MIGQGELAKGAGPYWKVRMLRRIYSAYNLVDYAKIGVILPVYLAISNWRGVNRSSQK